MKIDIKTYNSIATLISSIILFIFGAFMFSKPDEVLKFASYVIGGLIFLLGAYNCIKNYLDVKKRPETKSYGMIMGVFLIIIGLVVIFLSGAIDVLVCFIIGGWILFSGINRLMYALTLPKKSKQFAIFLILGLVLIAGGVYTVLNTSFWFNKYLGLILMIYATIEIIGYIFSHKQEGVTNFGTNNVTEAVITYEASEAVVKDEKVEDDSSKEIKEDSSQEEKKEEPNSKKKNNKKNKKKDK